MNLLAEVFQIRNPKSEIRRKSEARNPKFQSSFGLSRWRGLHTAVRQLRQPNSLVSDFGLRFSDFFRPSDFGFRILDTPQKRKTTKGLIVAFLTICCAG